MYNSLFAISLCGLYKGTNNYPMYKLFFYNTLGTSESASGVLEILQTLFSSIDARNNLSEKLIAISHRNLLNVLHCPSIK